MKIVAFIMALIVLGFTAMPCMDESFVVSETTASSGIAQAQPTKKHTDKDLCSPFCTCNCCAGFTILFLQALAQPAVFAPAKMYASYLPSNSIQISLPVWQPPQLV